MNFGSNKMFPAVVVLRSRSNDSVGGGGGSSLDAVLAARWYGETVVPCAENVVGELATGELRRR